MGALTKIYWIRFFLGIVAALICVLYGVYTKNIYGELGLFDFITFFTLALLVHLLSYYVFKHFYFAKVEKPTKLFTTGIGIYFISWIVFLVLFWTIYFSSFT